MRSFPRPPRLPALLIPGLLVALAACDPGTSEGVQVPDEHDLGDVDVPTSCTDAVEADLERGVALLHHMTYVEALGVFREAAEQEPDCAMAHWGLAMAHFQPFRGEHDVEAGRPSAERAVAVEAPTERERRYAEAVHAYFAAPDASLPERVRSWESAMDARAGEGATYARAYEDVAPSIPHALHMPSHIYVRLAEWEEVIEWNRRSADAALELPAADGLSLHYAHALDYLMYGYLRFWARPERRTRPERRRALSATTSASPSSRRRPRHTATGWRRPGPGWRRDEVPSGGCPEVPGIEDTPGSREAERRTSWLSERMAQRLSSKHWIPVPPSACATWPAGRGTLSAPPHRHGLQLHLRESI